MTASGLFVTGTGTGVGKSIVSASIASALAEGDRRVAAFKPVVTGLDEPDPVWPMDHELLASATGRLRPTDVAPYLFGPAVSPHLAAELAEVEIDPALLKSAHDELSADADLIVCEGVGGLLVPLTSDFSVLDLVLLLGHPVVVAAHPGLGTISDTRLTVDRLRAEGARVAGVVLSGWPRQPGVIENSNLETLQGLLGTDVVTLPVVEIDGLAAAGSALPLDRWLA